jgi:hypothetical protein
MYASLHAVSTVVQFHNHLGRVRVAALLVQVQDHGHQEGVLVVISDHHLREHSIPFLYEKIDKIRKKRVGCVCQVHES